MKPDIEELRKKSRMSTRCFTTAFPNFLIESSFLDFGLPP